MTENNKELKACPFCGGKAKFTEAKYGYDFAQLADAVVQCKDCDAFLSTCDTVNDWNTRHNETPTGEIGELIKLINQLEGVKSLDGARYIKPFERTQIDLESANFASASVKTCTVRDLLTDCKAQLIAQHKELSKLYTENDALGFGNTQILQQAQKMRSALIGAKKCIDVVAEWERENGCVYGSLPCQLENLANNFFLTNFRQAQVDIKQALNNEG